MNGAQAMIQCLDQENIHTIFGYPGVAIAPFYEALYGSDVRHVLVRQEQNAGHAASGFARISGRPAVCVTTSGPGALNLITAVATAYADSIPLIAVTGQVARRLIGRDVFQEADVIGAMEPFTKYRYMVRRADDIPRVMKEAFYIASTGRKGPVLIDLPIDVQQEELTQPFHYPEDVSIRGYKPHLKGNGQQLRRVLQALKAAEKPLLCAGGGVISSGAQDLVRSFCEKHGIPAVTTMMGIGAFPSAHPLYYGMIGNNGRSYANKAMSESDLLIIAGARVADRAMPNTRRLEETAKVIHIDIDTAEIGKNIGPTIPLVGDLRDVFQRLLDQELQLDTSTWREALAGWKDAAMDHRIHSPRLVDPNTLVQKLTARMDPDAVYCADVGQNQMWSAINYEMKEGRFLTTGGMGTMGYAVPCALGARMAAPDRQTVAVCGDGAFQMSFIELATAQAEGVPMKVVVMRNHYLGLVKEYQDKNYGGHHSGVALGDGPDFGKIACAYGMSYYEVSENQALDRTLDRFLQDPGSALLVCQVDDVNNTK